MIRSGDRIVPVAWGVYNAMQERVFCSLVIIFIVPVPIAAHGDSVDPSYVCMLMGLARLV